MVSNTLLALLLVPTIAAASSAGDPSRQMVEAEAQEALRLSQSPRGAVHLIRLHHFRDEVADLNLLAQRYQQILNQRTAHPMNRSLARLFAADIERARGKIGRAAEYVEPLGYIHDFYVLGSFDNEGKGGCGLDFGPEAALDLAAEYPAKGHPARWRRLSLQPSDGYIDLSTSLRPNREAVAYALTFLHATQETMVHLGTGASGAFRLWVNGQLAVSQDRYNRARPDQSRVAVRLRRGDNRVLLKVCQDGGPFGFYLRQERAGPGRVTALLPETLPPLPKGASPSPRPLPTLPTLLEEQVARHPADPELRGEYATALAYFRAFDDSEHTDAVEAETAAEASPSDPTLQLLAARLQEDDPNLRRKRLDAALRADPTSPWARLRLAEHELSQGHPERALPILSQLSGEQPNFAPARLALIHAHDALGEWPRALALIEAALRDWPHLPRVVREAARASRRIDRPQEGVVRLRVALALRYDDFQARRSLASALTSLNQVDQAEEEMAHLLKLDPFDNSSRLRLAELYLVNGNSAQADRLFAEAKALAPDDPEVHEREGRALLQAGRRNEALAGFGRSLQLRPQNPVLKEAWRSLQGEKSSPGSEFAFDLESLVKEADAMAGEDAVYLADYTYVHVQPTGLSSRFEQMGVKVYTQRGVDAFRSFPITYSPDRQEVRILRARVIKPNGSIVESYSESERSINEPWARMYYDARAKVLSFPSLAPGDILELRYQLDDSAQENLLSDYWGDVDYIQATSPKIRYQYIADLPDSRPIYWNRSRLGPGIAEQQDRRAGRTLYRWTAKYVPKVIPEPSMPGWAEVVPTLHVSTYKTWDQVGRYYWSLVRDQLKPNEQLRKTVEKALAGVNRKDELAVVRAIYNFVVKNTRYVALEFGIHGYKPYRVDRVLARRYGDCKDKASLIHTMLKVAGVDSRLVLLRMRHLGSIGEEPASLAAFNHAIAYVPKYNLFLDGTADFHSSRELPGSDHMANVLIVEPNGNSPFQTTPEAKAEDNRSRISLEVALRVDGSAAISGRTTVAGENAPEYRRSYQTPATRKATFEQGWAQAFPGLTVQQVSLNDPGNLDEDVKLNYQMNVPRYAEVSPKALRFFPFGSTRAYTQTYAPLSERRYDLMLAQPWVTSYEFQYTLPPEFSAELPPDLKEETPYGKIRMWHRVENGKIVCRAEVALTQTRIKASEYGAFRAFLGRLDQAFSRKIFTGAVGQTARK
jgi:Flp pilus assembly protein TadD